MVPLIVDSRAQNATNPVQHAAQQQVCLVPLALKPGIGTYFFIIIHVLLSVLIKHIVRSMDLCVLHVLWDVPFVMECRHKTALNVNWTRMEPLFIY